VRTLDLYSLYKITDSDYNITIGNASKTFPGSNPAFDAVNGHTVHMAEYFDDRYPHMTPIHCSQLHSDLTGDVSKDFCLMDIGNTYAYPVFNHFGDYVHMNDSYPQLCEW
jgi:hypothetical protein